MRSRLKLRQMWKLTIVDLVSGRLRYELEPKGPPRCCLQMHEQRRDSTLQSAETEGLELRRYEPIESLLQATASLYRHPCLPDETNKQYPNSPLAKRVQA